MGLVDEADRFALSALQGECTVFHLQPHHLRHRPIARAVVLVVALLLAAGCGLIGDQQVAAPETSAPAPSPASASSTASASGTAAPTTASSSITEGAAPTDELAQDDGSADEGGTSDQGGAGGGDDARSGGNDDRAPGAGDDEATAGGGNGGSGGGSSSDDGQVADRTLTRGDSGAAVRRLQQRLEDLHYWVGATDGVFGQLTEQAVYAFQGVEGIAIDGVVGPNTRAHLADASPPQPRSDGGDLIEVDEQARVVMDVRGGEVRWAWHTSTGTNEHYQHPGGYTALAETPNGRQTIDWQVDGVRDGDLGPLWRPKYFNSDGIAIHGYPSVPATPSSHGCVRVTKPAMDFIWANDIAPKGSTVWVYGRTP